MFRGGLGPEGFCLEGFVSEGVMSAGIMSWIHGLIGHTALGASESYIQTMTTKHGIAIVTTIFNHTVERRFPHLNTRVV